MNQSNYYRVAVLWEQSTTFGESVELEFKVNVSSSQKKSKADSTNTPSTGSSKNTRRSVNF